ncbi:MAG: GGDEF domain-containing protein [gamma proteobacterium symbiont of Lucinoma myriamae]|nr:GGDEF domain-containing protein [gamma proteobacterium symbiont of Lucinoma myriamae]
MASHDSLTGLINRREIIRHLNQEMIRFHRYHSPISILFIDNFKVINDTHGHNIGDKTLIDCARKMSSLMRRNDTIGRYGGEEFLVILPETQTKKAFDLAERLRKYIDKHSENSEKQIPHYTISIGITELTDDQITINTFLNTADKAMYKAKQTGRNRTCIDSCRESL